MQHFYRFSIVSFAVFALAFVRPVFAQSDLIRDAQAAMASGDYARAANLLSASIGSQPSADAYVYLGISYGHTREWARAEETLKRGAERYPADPRFHNELAGVYLAANDLVKARESLRTALTVDPSNKYAIDLLATVDMSMGNIREALAMWNGEGKPIVGDVLHNAHLESETWIVGKASAFQPGDLLTWDKWKTTEERLRESDIYANVGAEIEPTPDLNRYTVVIRTAPKTNSTEQFVIPLLEAAFLQTPSFHIWNIGNSAINVNNRYRFATNRHLAEVGISVPFPVPGVLFFDATGTFRSERWDISRPAIENGIDHRFRFQSTGVRAEVRHIPHYRFQLGAGFEYRNRTVSGSQPGLVLDSRNTGKVIFETTVLPADGRLRSRVHAEGFLAREALLSDLNYSGGTLEWNNRFELDRDSAFNVEVSGKVGTSRGELPVDDYFILGLKDRPENLLRGHNAVSSVGHYGHAPMGTSFALVNSTLDRRIRRFPFFNTLNIPYVDLKWEVFLDGAKAFDRADVFEEGRLLVDAGAGFKLESPTRAFHLTYGRSLRDGTGTLAAYVLQRW